MKTGKERRKWNKSFEGEGGVECDAATFARMREMLYRYVGVWKARLPYYGVLDAHEIEVSDFVHPKLGSQVANNYVVPDGRTCIAK
jgi:hypothetical protein